MDTGAADCGVMCTFIKELLEGHLKVGFLVVMKMYPTPEGGKNNQICLRVDHDSYEALFSKLILNFKSICSQSVGARIENG